MGLSSDMISVVLKQQNRLISARLCPSGQNEELSRKHKSQEKVVRTCHMKTIHLAIPEEGSA